MPEQGSRRALPITNQPSLEPFETPVVPLGAGGLNLKDAPDKVERGQFRRLTNLVHRGDNQLTVRPGQTALTNTIGTLHHSARRFNDPSDGSWTRLYGVDGNLYSGQSGALSLVDAGYSGDPLTLVPYRPPLSGETWMFVADRDRMRKVRGDGLDLPIGLTPPSVAAVATPVAATPKYIAHFDATDGSDAANWTPNEGFDYSDPPQASGIPAVRDFPGLVGSHVGFLTQPSTAVITANKGYYSYWNLPRALDLSTVNGQPASDDDIVHLWLKLSHPSLTAEVRIYLVCSSTFSPTVLPGTSAANENDEFYMHAFRGHDFAQALAAAQAMVDAAETARVHDLRDEDLKRRKIADDRVSWAERRAERDPGRARTDQSVAGVQTWIEYGIIGVPLRRGDFQRFGTSDSRHWGTITGLVVYIQHLTPPMGNIEFYLDDMYLTGGFDPDTSEPGAQLYDYRYIHYDPRTGAKSNPSPEMASGIDLLRQSATVTPDTFGSSAIRQRIYRRGGSTLEWFFLGENSSDGGTFTDTYSDAFALANDALEFDNYAAVPTVDANGDTVLAQQAPILFGPVEDLLFALGLPEQPGHVYFCKPGLPDMWPATNNVEVCAPSEELMTGGVYNGQAFCFSRERFYLLYPSLNTTAVTVTAVPGACTKGCISRWGMAVGRGGIYFVAEDGVYRTAGGGPEEKISEALDPLFRGESVEGYLPIDLTAATAIRLALHDWDLWVVYQDTNGDRRTLVYSVLYQYWRSVAFDADIAHAYSDEGAGADVLLLGGLTSGVTYTHTGTTDAGTAIPYLFRTGDDDFGRPREDKLFGDLILDAASQGTVIDVTTRLNSGDVVNATQQIATAALSRVRLIFDAFGVKPQKARTLALEVSGSSSATPPIFYQWGASIIPQPDVTITRVTQWDDLGHPDEVYLTGLTIDVDTGNGTKEFLVEYDNADTPGVWNTLGPFVVLSDNRHKWKFSWAAVKAHLVRIRPIGDCTPWMLYRADWIFDPEPPRIAGWDINHENAWDQYVTGFDLECNTFGLDKTVEFYADQTLIQTYTVNANGRRVVHLTVQPPIRGHILRFVATDANVGLLYSHRWHSDPEPSEQTNWNQNYSIEGTLGDKWLKAVIFECDTFGLDKTVTLEVDHVVVETLTVNCTNRNSLQFSFPQHRGRVFRILPTDANPGRLYTHQLVFDQEPFCFTRWETQEITHGMNGWMVVYEMHVTLRAAEDVTLTVYAYRQDGSAKIESYTIPKTGTDKIKRFVPLRKSKGVLYKYVLTSPTAFWLYREETEVHVAQWGSSQTFLVKPFGNDDLDQTRGMTNATTAAERPGGQL